MTMTIGSIHGCRQYGGGVWRQPPLSWADCVTSLLPLCPAGSVIFLSIFSLLSAPKPAAFPPPSPPLWQAVCASLVAAQAAMQNLATSMFNTVALEPTYDAQPGPNVPLQGGSATGVMQPMKRTTILFHTLFKVACLPADAGRANPTARCSPAGPTHAAGFGPPHVRLRVVDLR